MRPRTLNSGQACYQIAVVSWTCSKSQIVSRMRSRIDSVIIGFEFESTLESNQRLGLRVWIIGLFM